MGPPADVVDLADVGGVAVGRPAGRRSSARRRRRRVVRGLPLRLRAPCRSAATVADSPHERADRARRCCGPTAAGRVDPLPLVLAAARLGAGARGDAVGGHRAATRPRRLRRAGVRRRRASRATGRGRGREPTSSVGARAAAWAPVPDLAVGRRARRARRGATRRSGRRPGTPATSPSSGRAGPACRACSCRRAPPSKRSAWGAARHRRAAMRSGRAGRSLDVVDRARRRPRRTGLCSERARAACSAATDRVVCVLNRTGRARLLACAACGELAPLRAVRRRGRSSRRRTLECRTLRHRAAAGLPARAAPRASRTCAPASSRVREELEALAGEPVVEVTGATDDAAPPPRGCTSAPRPCCTGSTEADAVAFLDFDQELLAPRYRAASRRFALLARAAQAGRRPARRRSRVLVQTRRAEPRGARRRAPRRSGTRERCGGPTSTRSRLPAREGDGSGLRRGGGRVHRDAGRAARRRRARACEGHVARSGRVVRGARRRTSQRVPRPAARLRIDVDPLRV